MRAEFGDVESSNALPDDTLEGPFARLWRVFLGPSSSKEVHVRPSQHPLRLSRRG